MLNSYKTRYKSFQNCFYKYILNVYNELKKVWFSLCSRQRINKRDPAGHVQIVSNDRKKGSKGNKYADISGKYIYVIWFTT